MSEFAEQVLAIVTMATAARVELRKDAPVEPAVEKKPLLTVTDTLPTKLLLRGKLEGGGSLYVYRNEEYDVLVAQRHVRNEIPETVYLCLRLAGEEFKTWPLLRAAMRMQTV